MLWSVAAALDLILLLGPPVGIVLTWREVIRSRPLTTNPTRSLAMILGLAGVTMSNAMLLLGLSWLGLLGFLATYPSRKFILVNVALCLAGLLSALSAKGRSRLALSSSSVVLVLSWLWEMTPLPRRFITG